jgi:hypothetical protein
MNNNINTFESGRTFCARQIGLPRGPKIGLVSASVLCLLTILAILAGLVSAKAQNLVFTSQIIPAPIYPTESVAATDVNGDGKLDLVVGETAKVGVGDNLTIFTNNGSGIFGSNALVNLPSQPTQVVAEDIDGSGKPALIASCSPDSFTNGFVIVFTNNGFGVYGLNATYPLDAWPLSITAADLSGDGQTDLITANVGYNNGTPILAGSITILTNNGTGGFSQSQELNSGLETRVTIATDIGGDGKLDIISGNSAPSLTIFTNNNLGWFGSNAVINTGFPCVQVAAADINGDDKPDLICANYGTNTLTLFTNNGWGGFGSNSTLVVAAGIYFSFVVADINGDGAPDLLVANGYDSNGNVTTGTLTIFTNNGAGIFGFNSTIPVFSQPFVALAADLNGSGKLDVVLESEDYYAQAIEVLTQVSITPPVFSQIALGANGNLTFNLLTTTNVASRVYTASNLSPPIVWLPLYTNLVGGLWQFADTNTGAAQTKFYRLSTP